MTNHITQTTVPGLTYPISKLILGCDNKDSAVEGQPVWEAFMAAGGNSFDTAFVYGGGKHEKALGDWISARQIEGEINVICKGAHTPHCLPAAISEQLSVSLERLQIARAPIYIMHRDNLEVPVGEFVDAINREITNGRIGIYGGSNWSVARFEAACDYARKQNLQPPTILNNNLSLAIMERPVWPGCVTSNTMESLAYLRHNNIVHFSWSSQARGYFLPPGLRDRLPEDTRPETCFGSPANAERRTRAETLAAKHGVSAHNIATAWVLAQSFPSFALIGARNADEIATTLPAFKVGLSPQDIAWLNLERDT